MRDDGPWMESVSHASHPDFYLTHSIWHNGYGKCPETGVRPTINGKVSQGDFRLVQHNCFDFQFAEPIILCGLRKGWDACRIAALVEWLANRRRPSARLL